MSVKAYDRGIYYSQVYRTLERYLHDLYEMQQIGFYLVSSGVCAASTAVEAVGGSWKIDGLSINNEKFMTPADIMFNFIYNSRSTPIRDHALCENEVPDNLAYGIKVLSSVKAHTKYFHDINNMISTLSYDLENKNNSVVLSYRTNDDSGHYISVVDFSDKFVCYDSWGENPLCKNKGIQEYYDPSFFLDRCKERLRYILIEGK